MSDSGIGVKLKKHLYAVLQTNVYLMFYSNILGIGKESLEKIFELISLFNFYLSCPAKYIYAYYIYIYIYVEMNLVWLVVYILANVCQLQLKY